MKKKIGFNSKTPNPTHPDTGAIKVMKPGYSGGHFYSKGYVVFYNDYGQPMNPNTGQPLSALNWHFEFQ